MSDYQNFETDQNLRSKEHCTTYVCTKGSRVMLNWTNYKLCASPYLPQRNGDMGTVVSHDSSSSYSRIRFDNPRLHGKPEMDVFYEHLVAVTPQTFRYTLY